MTGVSKVSGRVERNRLGSMPTRHSSMQDKRRWSNAVLSRAQGRQMVGSLGQHQDLTSLLEAFENGGCDGPGARLVRRQSAEDSVNGGVCRQVDRCLQRVGDVWG
jgi:hypothetical protein